MVGTGAASANLAVFSVFQPENCITTYEPQAYIVVYSVVDRSSLQIAEETLQSLWKTDSIASKAVILVGNKTDLVRSRTVTTEGESAALGRSTRRWGGVLSRDQSRRVPPNRINNRSQKPRNGKDLNSNGFSRSGFGSALSAPSCCYLLTEEEAAVAPKRVTCRCRSERNIIHAPTPPPPFLPLLFRYL